MRRSLTVIVCLAALVAGVGPAGAGESEAIVDFTPFLVTPDDLDQIPGLGLGTPFAYDGALGGEDDSFSDVLPACGKTPGAFEQAATTQLDAGGDATLVHDVGAVANAKKLVAAARKLLKKCEGTYPSGSSTFTLLAEQPKLTGFGDGSLAYAVEGRTILYGLYVRLGKGLLATVIVTGGSLELSGETLNVIAKFMEVRLEDARRVAGGGS